MKRKLIVAAMTGLFIAQFCIDREEAMTIDNREELIAPRSWRNVVASAVKKMPQVSGVIPASKQPPFDQSKLLPYQNRILCELRQIHAKVPIQGKVQIISTLLPPYDFSAERSAWIKSPECPVGRHSVVHFGPDRKISLEKDCRTASLTELTTHSGMQGQINHAPSKGSALNLAIGGPGHLLLQCPKGDLLLTRDGKLERNNRGYYQNQSGCLVLNTHGLPFSAQGNLRTDGCTTRGECLSMVYAGSKEVIGLRYRSSNSFTATSVATALAQVKKGSGSRLIVNALEELANEVGPTSVSWEHEEEFELDNLDCPTSTTF